MSKTNAIYKKAHRLLFCSYNAWFTNAVVFPRFQTSTRMWHCLCAYGIIGDNVYDLRKLVPYDWIFIFCSFFSRTFFGCLHPSAKMFHLGNKSLSFSGIIVSTQLSVLIFTLEELALICSYLDKVLSIKRCKNVDAPWSVCLF